MVWNSTQSALYKAINRHNDGFYAEENSSEKNRCKSAEKGQQKTTVNNAKNRSEMRTQKRCEKYSENGGCSSLNYHRNGEPADPISRIMSDRDMLLIAGLIFILWRENADKKLIMALAIVLLG